MSDSSKTAMLLNSLVAEKDPRGIAIFALQKIQDSMKTTGGDSVKATQLKAAASLRAAGNAKLAEEIEKEAAKLPTSVRGVSTSEAIKLMEPHLAILGKSTEDIVSNGAGALTTKVLYAIGLEKGVFEKPETKKVTKIEPAKPTTK